jgi:hypothetical protein
MGDRKFKVIHISRASSVLVASTFVLRGTIRYTPPTSAKPATTTHSGEKFVRPCHAMLHHLPRRRFYHYEPSLGVASCGRIVAAVMNATAQRIVSANTQASQDLIGVKIHTMKTRALHYYHRCNDGSSTSGERTQPGDTVRPGSPAYMACYSREKSGVFPNGRCGGKPFAPYGENTFAVIVIAT